MSAKKKTKRKSPKIILEKKKVFILTSTIVILSILLLFINILFSARPQTSQPAEPVAHKAPQQEQPAKPEPPVNPPSPKAETKMPSASNQKTAEQPHAESSAKPKGNAACPYDIPKAEKGSTLVFIIDDAGHSLENLKKYTALPFPITIAVLPRVAETEACARHIVAAKKELILHQPMQAENLSVNPGPGAITQNMNLGEIKATVKANLAQLGSGVKGLNNHEGSLITEDEVRIGAVLDAAREYGVYFIDSRTTAQTKAKEAADIRGMTVRHRDIFIDNIIDKNEMLKQIYHGLALANKNGTAIMIGHVDKSVHVLPDLLMDMYPYLTEKGYTLEVPSHLK